MKKIFATALATLACISTLIFVSCPQAPQSASGSDVVTTFKVSSLPDYVENISICFDPEGRNHIWGFNSSDTYPCVREIHTGDGFNGQSLSVGMELYVTIDFDCHTGEPVNIGTLIGERPFKLLLNGTALEETTQTFEEGTWTGSGTEPTGRTYNLQQLNTYKAKFVVGSTVELTFEKGDLRKLEAGDIKYTGTTGFSYIKIDDEKSFQSVQLDYEDAGNTYQANNVYGMYSIPVNKKVRVIFRPKDGWELGKTSFRADNSPLIEDKEQGMPEDFCGKVTSLGEGQILTLSGTTTAIKDNLKAKGLNLESKFKKLGSTEVTEADNELKLEFKDFKEGTNDNKVTIKTSSQSLNGTWYYKNSYTISIHGDSTSYYGEVYSLYKEDEAWIAYSSGNGGNYYYFADKTITCDSNILAESGTFNIRPTFIGFAPDDENIEVIIDGNKNATVKKNEWEENYYAVTLDESWNLDPKEKHTYYVKAGEAKSAEHEFLIKQILISLPENTSTFEIGSALELSCEYVNYENFEISSDRFYTVLATGDNYPIFKEDENHTWTERYIEFSLKIEDGKILVPTYKFLNEETTLYLCGNGGYESALSNKVSLNFTYPDATLTIGGEENEDGTLNRERPVIGEENLYSYKFSKNIKPYKAEALVTLERFIWDESQQEYVAVAEEYNKPQFYLPVNDDGTFSLYEGTENVVNEYALGYYDPLETNSDNASPKSVNVEFYLGEKYVIKEAKLCGITATGTVTFKPIARDTQIITITDTSDVEVTAGTSIRVPVTLNPAPTTNNPITVYMGTYGEGQEDEVTDYGRVAFDIREGQTEIVLPTYGADAIEGYLYFSTRNEKGAEKYIPNKTESKKFKIKAPTGNISFKFFKEAETEEEDDEESASVNVTENDFWGLNRKLKAARTFTGENEGFTPDEPAYFVLYGRPSSYSETYRVPLMDFILVNEEGFLYYEEVPITYNMLMNALSSVAGSLSFSTGKQYIFWLESCAIKSEEITVNTVDNE